MKKLLLLGLIASTQIQAQELEWFNAEHRQGTERFYQMTYVESEIQPYLVAYMEQLIPQGGGGGTGPSVSHYLYAYDTLGNKLWDFQLPSAPTKILDAEDGNFWLILSSSQSLNINGTTLTSDFPYPEYRSRYFVKCNMNGEVVDYFYWESVWDILWFIQDIAIDINGDFIMTGRMYIDQFTEQELEFAGTSILLPDDKNILYVARANTSGEQLAISTMETNRFGPKAVIQYLAQNNQNGDIVIAGRINDVLTIGDEVISYDSPHHHLFLLRYNENLEFQQGNAFNSSTYGSICRALKFNPVNQRFYVSGSVGNEMTILNPDEPVLGHTGTVNNTYIAEFDGINLVQGQYLIPLGQGSTDNVNIQDISFDADGNIRLAANVHDFSFLYGDSVIAMPSFMLNYDLAIMTLRMSDLSIQALSRTMSDGQTYSSTSHFNTDGSALYVAGTFNGTFTYGDFNENSFAGLNDGFIMKLADEEDMTTSILIRSDDTDFVLFPNPASTHFSISTELKIESVAIQNLSGQVVMQYQVSGNQTFSTSDLSPGMYLVSIRAAEKTTVKKLIIQ